MNRIAPILSTLLVLSAPTLTAADTIIVDLNGSGDYTAIRPAVDAAADGDTVLVYPGDYRTAEDNHIDFQGKDIVLRSTAGRELTIIYGYFSDFVFLFESGEGPPCLVEGFTVRDVGGGAFIIRDSSPTIRSCRFYSLSASPGDPPSAQICAVGGADGGSVVIEDCVFDENSAGASISVMHFMNCSVQIRDCLFSENVEHGAGLGYYSGVVRFTNTSSVMMERCSFIENVILDCCISVSGSGDVEIRDCDFLRNTHYIAPPAGESLMQFGTSGSVVVAGCTIAGNMVVDSCLSLRSEAMGQVMNCTFVNNVGAMNAVLKVREPAREGAAFSDCILAFNDCPVPIACDVSLPTISACCFYETGDPDAMCQPYDPESLLLEDPLFCDFYAGDFTLCVNSPCLIPHNDWGVQIGAHGWGCDACDSPVEHTSWGSIKAMFR